MIIADENLRAKWDDFAKRIRLMTGNAFGFVAAEAAYKGGQEWLDKVKKQIVDNDQYLRELFKENLPKVVVTPLEATYLVWIDLRAYIKPEDTKEFIQKKCRLAVDRRLVRGRQIQWIYPYESCYFQRKCGNRCETYY